MNTTTATTARRSPTRVFAALLLTLGAVLGLSATMAAPAQAASYVEGCFRSTTAGYGFWGTPVKLQAYWQGSWYNIYSTGLDRNSCTQINIGANHQGYPLRLLVNERVGTALFNGVSPGVAPAGTGRWNVGTGVVTCYGCR